MRRRELFRIAVADVLGLLDVDAVGEALTDVARRHARRGALAAATPAVEAELREPLPTRMAVDRDGPARRPRDGLRQRRRRDVRARPASRADGAGATEAAHAVAQELRRLLALPGADPPLELDAGLRPEGKQGPLVRTLASYAAYYARWSQPWEAQALLRAEPSAGDAEVWRAVPRAGRPAALARPTAWTTASVREIRRIKARVDAERLPRGADPRRHVKLGPGGLTDVEWTVQLLQLRHAARVAGLRTTATLPALEAAVEAACWTAPTPTRSRPRGGWRSGCATR